MMKVPLSLRHFCVYSILCSLLTIQAVFAAPVGVTINGAVTEIDDPGGLLSSVLGLSLSLGDSFSGTYMLDDTVSVGPPSISQSGFTTYAFDGSLSDISLTFGGSEGVEGIGGFSVIQIANERFFPDAPGGPITGDFWQIVEPLTGPIAPDGSSLIITLFFIDTSLQKVDPAESFFVNPSTDGWDIGGFVILQAFADESTQILAIGSVEFDFSANINFSGPLAIVEKDDDGAIYSGVPIGSDFFGVISSQTANGFISDGTTLTPLGCCFESDFIEVDNNESLNASDTALLNSLAGTNYVEGDEFDFIGIEVEALTSGGGRIEVELITVLDPLAFDDESLNNYPPNPDDILITLFAITEEVDRGLTISFDTFDNPGSDAIAIDVFVDGALVARDLTNPFTDGSLVPVSVSFDADGTLDLTFDGSPIFVGLLTGFTPQGADRFGFGGRTGAGNEVNRIDNVSIAACTDPAGCPPPDAEYVNDFSASVGPASLFGDATLDSGSVRLTDSINEQSGSLVINDLVPGEAVASFTATFDLQMGPGSVPPADGISFNLGPLEDSAFGEEGGNQEVNIYSAFGVVTNSTGSDISDKADVSPSAIIEINAEISQGASVGDGAHIGANAEVNQGASVEADATIDDGATISKNAFVGEGAFVGAGASIDQGAYIGPGAIIGAGANVGKNTVICAGAEVLPNSTVGKNGFVDTNTVVGDLPANKDPSVPGDCSPSA